MDADVVQAVNERIAALEGDLAALRRVRDLFGAANGHGPSDIGNLVARLHKQKSGTKVSAGTVASVVAAVRKAGHPVSPIELTDTIPKSLSSISIAMRAALRAGDLIQPSRGKYTTK